MKIERGFKMKTTWMIGLLTFLLPVMVIADSNTPPASQPSNEIVYKNKVRTQTWFDEQYDKFKYSFARDKNGIWKDIGFKICKMKDEGIYESYAVGTIAQVSEDFKFIYLIKSIKGKDVVVHKAFNPVDRVYVQGVPKNRGMSMSATDMKQMTINGKWAMNTSWTFDFVIEGYAEGRKLKVGDKVKGIFVCEKNGYENGKMPVWSEIRPLTEDDFRDILASKITLCEYENKPIEKKIRKRQSDGSYDISYKKVDHIIRKPVN
jgi:hypothetical protein